MHFLWEWEKQDAKVGDDKIDRRGGGTDPDRRSSRDGAESERQGTAAGRYKSAIVDSRSPDRPPPAARRSSAFREIFGRPERSPEQGKRRARQEDQEHLPRLLNRAASIRHCARRAPRRPSRRRRTAD